MQLLGSPKSDIENNKDGETVPRLETVEVALVHCNLVILLTYLCYLLLYQTQNLVN